jgi:uncharacterized membrane protein
MTVQNHPCQSSANMLKACLFLMLIATMVPMVRGYTIGSIEINDLLEEDMTLQESITVTVLNNSLPSLQFSLPEKAYQIFLNGQIPTPDNNTIIVPLDCRDCLFKIAYKMDGIAKRDGKNFIFSRTLNFPGNPANLDYAVHLPAGYVLDMAAQEPAIVPTTSAIETDGKDIIIRWKQVNPSLPQVYYLRYMTSENVGITDIREELGESPVMVMIVIAFLAGCLAAFAILKLRKPIPMVPASVLTSDEKAVIALIRSNGMKMNQKEVVKSLNWSKSKVSAVMTTLQSKRLIEREKFGRNYKVTLVSEVA